MASTEVSAVQINTASSAYRMTRAFLTTFGKLLTQMLNNKGPKMLSCVWRRGNEIIHHLSILFDVFEEDMIGETLTSPGQLCDSENQMPSKYRQTVDR